MDLLTLGLDLLDFYRGKLSLRRLCVAVSQLPMDSRLIAELAQTEKWSLSDFLVASLIDAVQWGNYLQETWLYGNSDKSGAEPKPPKPMYRPGPPAKKEPVVFTDPVTLAGVVDSWG